MPKICFKPMNKCVDVPKGETVYNAALRLGLNVNSVCGGLGVCGKCKVRILKNGLSKPSSRELGILGLESIKKGFRLACQAKILDYSEVEVPIRRILIAAIMGYEPKVSLKTAIAREIVERKIVTLTSEHASTLESIVKGIGEEVLASLHTLRILAKDLPKKIHAITYKFKNMCELIDVFTEEDKLYGLALDVGTTKIAAYLVDLESGRTLVAEAFENPQVRYGDDVISRVAYAREHGVVELQKTLIRELNNFLTKLYKTRDIKPRNIVELVVVGNTVMHHTFLGINPEKLGKSPYELVMREPLVFNASELRVAVNPNAKIYMPPLVRGFIGSDSLMGVLLLGLTEKKGVYVFLDIGTNTEVYISKNGAIYAASTASGPAFEGAHIKYGMKAYEGAIDRVTIDPETLEPEISVIGNIAPAGICGSGIIDAVAEMLKAKIIDYTGKFVIRKHRRIRYYASEGHAYILAFKEETSIGEDIVITQKDIREIQKAKAAMQAAYKVLSAKLGINRKDINEIYVAGSFGFYMNPESAIIIGLLPEININKVKMVGNTAGSGARILLKNVKWRYKAEKIARNINYVELAVEPQFSKIYIKATYLPSGYVEEYPETIKKLQITELRDLNKIL